MEEQGASVVEEKVTTDAEIALKQKAIAILTEIGRNPEAIQTWASMKRSPKVWNKIVSRLQNAPKLQEDPNLENEKRNALPTRAHFEEWEKLPHEISSLNKILYPTLCGWTAEEVCQILTPYVGKVVQKFQTSRIPYEDCCQQGIMGILQALRTDAGIAPFAKHVFLHIKTKVRRASVGSGAIRKPEKMPSRTEVRREISIWVGGWWMEYEMQKIAGELKIPQAKLPINEFRQWLATAKEHPVLLARAENRLKLLNAPINQECLTNPDDYVIAPVQVIGVSDAKEVLLREDFVLARLCSSDAPDPELVPDPEQVPENKLHDLFAYLNRKFQYPLKRVLLARQKYNKSKGCFSKLKKVDEVETETVLGDDMSKYKTVADLVGAIATPPEFHDSLVPLDAPMDEEGYTHEQTTADEKVVEPSSELERQENLDKYRAILQEVRSRLQLSLEQETVLVYTYGLDGEKPVNGSELARNLGHYLTLMAQKKGRVAQDPSKHVSRQRITQYIDTVKRRIRDVMWVYFFIDGRKSVRNIMRDVELTSVELKILRAVFQTDRPVAELEREVEITMKERDLSRSDAQGVLVDESLECVAEQYRDVTGLDLDLNLQGRKTLVRDQFDTIKLKLVAACL